MKETIDTYESEAIGIKYDIDANHNDKFSFGVVLNIYTIGVILTIRDPTNHLRKGILII